MKISNFAVKRPVTITILVSVLILLGVISLSRLAVDFYPEMKLPYAAVITSYAGAGPEEVESQISKPIESVVGTVQNIEAIRSISLAGSSLVLIQFNWGTDMDMASLSMREKVALVEKALPSGSDKPMVVKMDPSMMPVLQIGISGGKDLGQLQDIATNDIKPALERVPGVASVTLTGGLTREVRVDVDPIKLQNYGISLSGVSAVLSADNFNQSAGTVKSGGRQYFVRNLQQYENVNDIRAVTITTASGQKVRLSDIAEITDGYQDITQYTRMNKKPSIGVHIQKQSDANTVAVSEGVQAELAGIKKKIPGDIKVGVVYDQAEFIKQSISGIQRTMIEGALLAMLIIFVFLRSLPSTLIIATSIPLSIVATFVLMYFDGMTMNLITMGGIALGIGRMVDDSIVVLESIYRHRQAGEKPMEAAIKGASEVGTAVMAATFTTVAVFVPILFVEGIAAILFKPMALTVSFAILSSLVVALTIIPLLASRMMKIEDHEAKAQQEGIRGAFHRLGAFMDGWGEWYRGIIQWALCHRKTIVFTVIGLMIASCALVPLIGAEFIPKTDAGQIAIKLEMDKGTAIEETNRVTEQIEKIVAAVPGVKTIFTSVGSSGNMMFGSSENDQATLKVMLSKKSERDRSTSDIVEELTGKLRNIPGVLINVSETDPSASGMNAEAPVQIRISGDDLEELKVLSARVAEQVRKVKGTRTVESSLTEGKPEVQVSVDRDKAAAYGLSAGQVANAVQTAVKGGIATRYRVEGDEIDVRVRYRLTSREDISDLENIMIQSPGGALVPLSQIASIKLARGPVSVSRYDQTRAADVTAQLGDRDLNTVMKDIQARVDKIQMPSGYRVEYVGQDKEMMESFISLFYALLLAIVLVYAVMAIQYESFFIPFVIMFSVPTCFIGVVAGLALTGKSFSVPAFIGVIMLVGIAVSNAIVLVDYIKTLRERGMARNAAIEEAGAIRLRPVLMTAFATILALLPLALGLGEGGETQMPMAIVVIGGLLASTVITLVLVPVMYTILDDLGQKFRRRKTAVASVLEESAAAGEGGA